MAQDALRLHAGGKKVIWVLDSKEYIDRAKDMSPGQFGRTEETYSVLGPKHPEASSKAAMPSEG